MTRKKTVRSRNVEPNTEVTEETYRHTLKPVDMRSELVQTETGKVEIQTEILADESGEVFEPGEGSTPVELKFVNLDELKISTDKVYEFGEGSAPDPVE